MNPSLVSPQSNPKHPRKCFCEPLSLSPLEGGCRRVLTPRCSMLSHLLKEQGLGGFEPPIFCITFLTGTSALGVANPPRVYLENSAISSATDALNLTKLQAHNEILNN